MLLCLVAVLLTLPQSSATEHEEPYIRAAKSQFDEGLQASEHKRYQEAAECFRKSIEIQPTFMSARRALISAYASTGDSLHEAAAITEYLEIQPDAKSYRLRLGQILIAQKQPQKALAQFALVLKEDPDNAEALLGFASAASRSGMQDRAEQALEHGRQRYPSDRRFESPHP